jgi:flagellar biosynthesis protein FliR
MIHLTTNQLQDWLALLYWPFVRIGSCLMIAPAFDAV